MTYEEAYGYLKKLMGCATRTGSEECLYKEYCDNCEYDYDSDKWEDAIATAKEALEKQMPKKPIAIDVGGQHELICPNCERNHVARHGIMYSYCNICGQRIDWSEVE